MPQKKSTRPASRAAIVSVDYRQPWRVIGENRIVSAVPEVVWSGLLALHLGAGYLAGMIRRRGID